MHSMTGYGRASVEQEGRQLTVELKSVNHRFLDLSFRMPRSFNFLEDTVRRIIGARLARGHVDVFVTYQNTRADSHQVTVDTGLVNAYMDALDQIRALTSLMDNRTLMAVAQMQDVMIVSDADEDQDILMKLMEEALSSALDQLIAMRTREGECLKTDILNRVKYLEKLTAHIEERYPTTVEEYKSRLRVRMGEMLQDTAFDEQRLLQEVAIMADRSAIEEETVRLKSHFGQMHEIAELAEPVGRKLDFLIQELNREVNTISSKSQDVPITRLVISAKAEIEKIREQVQNVE